MRGPSHFDRRGALRMVDVAGKPASLRRATAAATIWLGAQAHRVLRSGRVAKGDVLAVARLAGIQAAKRTAEWIPLCHPIPLEHVEVECRLPAREPRLEIRATATARWSTGVEMEALTAVAAAALTVYDMCKGIERGIVIREIRLLAKSGGRSGVWTAARPARSRRGPSRRSRPRRTGRRAQPSPGSRR